MLMKVRLAYADEVVGGLLGLLVLLISGVGGPVPVVAVSGEVALVAMTVLGRMLPEANLRDFRPLGGYLAGRLAVLVGIAQTVDVASVGSVWVPVVLVTGVGIGEAVLARLLRALTPLAVHLPGVSVRNTPPRPVRELFYVDMAAAAALVVLLAVAAPRWLLWLVSAVSVVVGLVAAARALLQVRDRQRAERRLRRTVTAYAPVFVVHWDAEVNAGYQLARWVPYLDRIGEPYLVAVRTPDLFETAAGLTDRPVVYCGTSTELEAVVVDTVRVAFYVNNAIKNAHLVRFRQLLHVELNHGDSDKEPSFSPVFRMFDKNFVAGQAAIDRFLRNGIATAPDFFEIVGRPQVEDVEQRGPARNPRRVLYAPTWAGQHTDSAYSSLPIGVRMVEALVARGCEVIYRPHPYTNRTPRLAAESARLVALLTADATKGRHHVFGRAAELDWSLIDCFNASDAMISDVSSVVPDYLYSEKPFAVTAMQGTAAEFAEEMPVSRAGYIIDRDAGNLDAVLDDLLGDDPKAALRHEVKTYYLGDLPAEHYADAFVDAARRLIASPRRSLLPALPGDEDDD